MIAFGPVPSRRLGRSVGINNIPPKVCTYACAYCQLGRTIRMQVDRQPFYPSEQVRREVQTRLARATDAGETVDYLTFVPDGEPTLDTGLEGHIDGLRALKIPIAVITNSSLIWQPEVRQALLAADWVSLKVDAASEAVWRRVDCPHRILRLETIVEGASQFALAYRGCLVTETMLVAGANDAEQELAAIADLLVQLRPQTAYVSVPTRPPAAKWVSPPTEAAVTQACQAFGERGLRSEHLLGYEGNAFAFTGDVEQDLLSITAVHPMREDAVGDYLRRAQADWAVVRGLAERGQLVETAYSGHRFFTRRLTRARPSSSA